MYKNQNFLFKESYLYTLIFIIPLLIIYEWRILSGGLGGSINGADAIFRMMWFFISSIIGSILASFLFGAVIIGLIIFIIYEIFQNKKEIILSKILLMYSESIVLGFFMAVLLFVGLNWQLPSFFSFEPSDTVVRQAIAGGLLTPWSKIIASVGAGIFEELLFRVILLNVLFIIISNNSKISSMRDNMPAFLKAAAISSLVFSLIHIGTVSSMAGLFFIFVGSLILSFIYLTRGYAIVAGTHIVFDLLLLFGVIGV